MLIGIAYENGYINASQKQKAEEYKAQTNTSDDKILLELKMVSQEQIAEMYAQIYGYSTEFEPEITDSEFTAQFPVSDLKKYSFVPVKEKEYIKIYTAKPAELLYAEDMVRDKTGYRGAFQYSVITYDSLQNIIEEIFKNNDSGGDIYESEENADSGVYNLNDEDTSEIILIVNKVVREAVENKASDIHFEPQSDGLYVRCRYDGTLKITQRYPLSVAGQVANRIKTMANIDVTNNRIIQDGSVRLAISGKTVDLRVSVVPAIYGENIVMRILDQNKMSLNISAIGFSEKDEEKFRKLIHIPQGIILFTGPTGSGKSTSIYAGLSMLNSEDRCIITFEDPVEYRIGGIVQIEINPHQDVTYPNAMKAGLRQDIDTALLGEIRDEETARIAFDAANTGHLVISTLHTNTAASAVLRMAQLNVEPYVIAQSLIAVINQRLARRICPYCKEEYILPLNSPYRKVLDCGTREVILSRGKGCKKCGGTGYMGRIAVLEFLVVNDEIKRCIERGGNTYEIEQLAIKNGMKKICDDGIEKALKGITTIDEIHRTVFFENI